MARSANGGTSWTETRVSTAGSNPNWEVRGSMRSPFFGDYNYVSAVGTTALLPVWTDTRDLVPGQRSARDGPNDDGRLRRRSRPAPGCPNDINAAAYSSPTIADPCLSQGGLDQNIYVATTP